MVEFLSEILAMKVPSFGVVYIAKSLLIEFVDNLEVGNRGACHPKMGK